MIIPKLKGRLGNQMFQVAAAYALALEHDDFISVNVDWQNGFDNRIGYNKTSVGCPFLYKETSFNHSPIPYHPNMIIEGYFQSSKYFGNYTKEIKELFKPYHKITEFVHDKYDNISEFTSIHVRRGDYTNIQEYHPLCTMEYYEESIDIIGKDSPFIVVSDDIEWCRENFIDGNFIFSDNDMFTDLAIQILCKNNIIANSSFSWWGAFLNNDNKVIAPKNWFGSAYSTFDTKDLYETNWIKI